MLLDRIVFHAAFGVSKTFCGSERRSEQQYTQKTQGTALLYVRSFQENCDKPEPVIVLPILMSGEREVSMNKNTLKMWLFKVIVCRESRKMSSVSNFYMHRSCRGSVARSSQQPRVTEILILSLV